MFGRDLEYRKYITSEDVTNGFDMFKKHKLEQDKKSKVPASMYT